MRVGVRVAEGVGVRVGVGVAEDTLDAELLEELRDELELESDDDELLEPPPPANIPKPARM